MTPHQHYDSKRMTAAQAAALISSGTDIAMGMAVAEPPALLGALAERVDKGALEQLNLWYFHSLAHAGSSLLHPTRLNRVRPHCMFMSGVERQIVKDHGEGLVEFVPVAFSESPRLFTGQVKLDAFITTVSPMDRHGWFTFGTSNDYSSVAARAARQLIVEVNPAMPRVYGDSLLHISEVSALVENTTPLFEAPQPVLDPEDEAIATLIASMIPDGACLQMGIGNLPSAVCARLTGRRDLGIHTELFTPALASLVQCGAVSNRFKATYPGRTVFTFAMGDRAFYDWLDDHAAMHAAPVNVVNDPRHIAKNPGVVSVNATLQVDLSGACNSEHMLGQQYSGAGGQLDFVRGANASKGGLSIIACRSTARGGTVSRIVPRLDGPVTTPRNDVRFIVTEYGVADMRGKTLRQRAEALIMLAHPAFREKLRASLG
ncbi:MAG TPA: acetyl-CoA hydrolase/transferase C-terminal domain-containing protein [Chakrabartia sp.]|jgi:itaconate CoA-transferase|nr:acetyl-CoA hydrolase/transferase C-terminal domain-containing protein [Chakrabartia sp.]